MERDPQDLGLDFVENCFILIDSVSRSRNVTVEFREFYFSSKFILIDMKMDFKTFVNLPIASEAELRLVSEKSNYG
jgi:hypothetical protein